MTPSQGLIDNMAPHIRVVFFVFIHGVFGAFFMIMIFLAAVLCPFFSESAYFFVVSSVELLNGLTFFCLVFIVTSRFSSANCFIDLLFYFVFLQVKLF